MKRRQFLSLLPATAVAGCFGDRREYDDNRTEPTSAETPPGAVEQYRPLMVDYADALADTHPDAKLFAHAQEGIALYYVTTSDSAGALESELHQLAALYGETVKANDHDAVTLTIITGQVQAIAPSPSVEAYADGRLKKDAYLETIEVTSP